MSHPPCSRAWQVEAARDGRLLRELRDDLGPHLAHCASCRAAHQGLARLTRDLSDGGEEVDQVALRRLRQRTLEKANWLVTRAAGAGRGRRTRTSVAALCVFVAMCLGWVTLSSRAPERSPVQVVPDHLAKWQRNLDRDVDRVDLSEGTLLFRVARAPADPRLIVRVPDGVIEDLGTVFSVSVHAGATRQIVVHEGDVMFHRRGATVLHLVAGSTWTAPDSPLPAAPPPAPAADRAPAASAVEATTLGTRRHGSSVRRPRPRLDARATARPAHALALVRGGEDEAYLHILTLLHEQRGDEARTAAAAYLRAFPAGFRRPEVARVAASQPTARASSRP